MKKKKRKKKEKENLRFPQTLCFNHMQVRTGLCSLPTKYMLRSFSTWLFHEPCIALTDHLPSSASCADHDGTG
jgi:hypothetical protein